MSDDKTLFNVMKRELREVKKSFATKRLSELQDQAEVIEIDTTSLIAEEDTYVSVTKAGYLKRTSPRSFSASTVEELGCRDDDELVFLSQAKTTQHLLLFTNLGNAIYRPVHELADIRWKDIGEHLSQTLTTFASNETIIHVDLVDTFETGTYLAVTQKGQIKRFERQELTPWRTYRSKSTKYAKLKDEEDTVLTLSPITVEEVMLVTEKGYALRFSSAEVPIIGAKAAGVKAINLKSDDNLVAAFTLTGQSIYILTQRGSIKRMNIDQIPVTSRANRGLLVLRELKTKPHRVFAAGSVNSPQDDLDLFNLVSETKEEVLEIISKTGKHYQIELAHLSEVERTHNGTFISDTISDEEVARAFLKRH